MSPKGILGKKTVSGQLGVLRQQAEKIVHETPGSAPENLLKLPATDPRRVLHDLQVHQIELELQNEELRRAQDALEISRERYFDLYDLAPVGYFTLDEGGLVLEANLTGAKLLDVMRGALVKQPFGRFVFSEDADKYYLHCKQLFRTGIAQALEVKLVRQNGEPFSAWLETAIASGAGGERVCRVVVSDITDRKAAEKTQASLEAQLRESQKMEAIGTLAGGIAHDFNNILGTILGNADLARQDAGSNWQALVSLDEIQKAGLRAKDLVQQILAFSRRQPTALRVMSLTPLVEESVRLLRAVLPGGVRLEYRCSADTPAVAADPTQIKQILINLGNNAAHAMRGQPGSIDICVEGVSLDMPSARFDLNLRPGRYARITFTDTGHGMDAATQRRIFEPFFTTKLPGEGTGLGLAVVHGIMQAHDGVIIPHSEAGKGSRFELYFPAARGGIDALGTTEIAGPASEGDGQHIVYVDDDESQAFLFKRMLERWGYRVSIYQEQRDALDALRSDGMQIDLVITDFNMPGLSGLEVARAIREARPDVPVIMVSGYITAALRAEAAAAGVRALMSKPHDVEELRDLLQQLIPRTATAIDR